MVNGIEAPRYQQPTQSSPREDAQLLRSKKEALVMNDMLDPNKMAEATRLTRAVRWFIPTKGYGFIQPQRGGGRDVFVHISAVELTEPA
jgi:hypothetical protein